MIALLRGRRRLLIICLAVFALFLVLALYFILIKTPDPNGLTPPSAYPANLEKQEKVGVPARLKIPKINVDAAVERVGLTSKGDVGVPKGPANAGWFNRWPRPGEKGDSVIVGHFGWRNNIPAVFDNLHKLQKGDKLYVQDAQGVIITFVVRESRKYDPEADALDVFRSNDGLAHLNLITCEGVWNKNQKSYSSRLVVFADRGVK